MNEIKMQEAYDHISGLFQSKVALRGNSPDIFVGRQKLIFSLVAAIQTKGSATALIGERGIGKTSLAWQVMRILSGDVALLKKNNYKLPFAVNNHLCFWVECERAMGNVEGMLIALLSRPQTQHDKSDITLSTQFQGGQLDRELESFLSAFIPKDELRRLHSPLQAPEDTGFTGHEIFLQRLIENRARIREYLRIVLGRIRNKGLEIIIFIDEFDRLPDKEGFGDLIKTINDARFVVVGIGDTIEEIFVDNISTERKLIGSVIEVDRFLEADINEFYDRIEQLSAQSGDVRLSFTNEFRKLAYEYCDGFPYVIQALGLQAFKNSWFSSFPNGFDNGELKMDKNSMILAIKNFLDSTARIGGRREKLDMARTNKNKTAILRHMASQSNGWQSMAALERHAKECAWKYRFLTNIKELHQAQILKHVDHRIRFFDPIYRAIIKYEIDGHSSAAEK